MRRVAHEPAGGSHVLEADARECGPRRQHGRRRRRGERPEGALPGAERPRGEPLPEGHERARARGAGAVLAQVRPAGAVDGGRGGVAGRERGRLFVPAGVAGVGAGAAGVCGGAGRVDRAHGAVVSYPGQARPAAASRRPQRLYGRAAAAASEADGEAGRPLEGQAAAAGFCQSAPVGPHEADAVLASAVHVGFGGRGHVHGD